MARPSFPEPVQLFHAILVPSAELFAEARERLILRFGPMDLESDAFPFDVTDYYEKEMGPGLLRWLVSYDRLISPEEIAAVKLESNRIEEELATGGRRRVNLDPGYMDVYKVVLASAKFQGPKIYLGAGIYADPTLYYDKGWKAFSWGFPDFRDGRYNNVLTQIRRLYKAKRKASSTDFTDYTEKPRGREIESP